MIQAVSSINCSPIKPQNHQSFGNREVLAATSAWLDEVNNGQLTEDNFIELQDITDKMNDGPLKTFGKILAIGGAAFVGIKAGSAKIAGKVTNNPTIQKSVTRPMTKFVQNGLETLGTKLKTSKYFGETAKGFKSYIVNNTAKALDYIEKYGQKGSEKITKNINAELKRLRAELKRPKISESRKESIQETIKLLKERKQFAGTENLITKATTTTAATGAGTIAVVEANKDRDGDGVADIGQHKQSA